jgi:hypothetical protein
MVIRKGATDMFIITKDFINDTNAGEKKLTGYKTARFIKEKCVHKFRLVDGGGKVYFHGLSSNDSSFAPLDSIGEAYGCVDIQYLEKTGWESL